MKIELKPCPFCGGTDIELKDYTEHVYGFWDYKIKCKTCRAYMDSPSTAIVTYYDTYMQQTRNDETKAKAKQELINAWNRRATVTVFEHTKKQRGLENASTQKKARTNHGRH